LAAAGLLPATGGARDPGDHHRRGVRRLGTGDHDAGAGPGVHVPDLPRAGHVLRGPFQPVRQQHPQERLPGAETAVPAGDDHGREGGGPGPHRTRGGVRRHGAAHHGPRGRGPLHPQRHQDVHHQRDHREHGARLRQDRSGAEGQGDQARPRRSSSSRTCASPRRTWSTRRTAGCT